MAEVSKERWDPIKMPPTVATMNTFRIMELGRTSNDWHTIISRKTLAMAVPPLPAGAHEGMAAITSAPAKRAIRPRAARYFKGSAAERRGPAATTRMLATTTKREWGESPPVATS
ncbi:MAG: hypothetical protein ACLUVF_01780 [Adlercreutzia sp.]